MFSVGNLLVWEICVIILPWQIQGQLSKPKGKTAMSRWLSYGMWLHTHCINGVCGSNKRWASWDEATREHLRVRTYLILLENWKSFLKHFVTRRNVGNEEKRLYQVRKKHDLMIPTVIIMITHIFKKNYCFYTLVSLLFSAILGLWNFRKRLFIRNRLFPLKIIYLTSVSIIPLSTN